jgi:hypothetical protein
MNLLIDFSKICVLFTSRLYCQISGDPYCLHLQGKPSKCIKEEIRYTKAKEGGQRILFLDSLTTGHCTA